MGFACARKFSLPPEKCCVVDSSEASCRASFSYPPFQRGCIPRVYYPVSVANNVAIHKLTLEKTEGPITNEHSNDIGNNVHTLQE